LVYAQAHHAKSGACQYFGEAIASPCFASAWAQKREQRPKFWYGLVSWASIQTVAYNAGQRQFFGVAAAGTNPNSP
jgi:hypothetical protein